MRISFSPRSISQSTLSADETGASSSSESSSHSPIKAEFSLDPIITGFLLPPDSDTKTLKRSVTVTVTPHSAVTECSPYIAGVDRVDVTIADVDESTGEMKLDVLGTDATPSDEPGGDTYLRIKHNPTDADIGEAAVIVVIPFSIQEPSSNPCFDSDVAGENTWIDSSTVPPDYNPLTLPEYVNLVTLYVADLTNQVLDQFGAALDDIYAGSSVYANGLNGNVTLDSSGTYYDPVGVWFETSGSNIMSELHPLKIRKLPFG